MPPPGNTPPADPLPADALPAEGPPAADRPSGPQPPAIRPAATLVLLRRRRAGPEVLMGQRGAAAAFLAAKYVFPGGALEAGDAAAGGALPPGALGARCAARLSRDPPAHPDTAAPALAQPSPAALAAAALRETREETGLALPAGLGLRFVFRAITPPGRPRRYDARFFLAEAEHLPAAPDRFGATDGELTDLRWLPLAEARGLDLPFVTAVMLAEIGALARLQPDQAPGRVGFIDNRTSTPQFHWID